MEKEPIKVIADIISHQMNLSPERIFIFNDGRELPVDDGLYVVLSITSRPPFGIKSEYKTVDGVLTNVTSMNVAERIIASVISKNTDARKRACEVQLAMSSYYAENQQQINGFHIGKIAPVTNNSGLEGTARLNRFDCEINIITAYEKADSVDYYDAFTHTEEFEG